MLPFLLFPNYCKWIGVLVYIAGYGLMFFATPDLDNSSDGLGLFVQVFILLGLLLIANARQKIEDEFIQHHRLVALRWSLVIFIALRLFHKCMAYFLKDPTWQPEGLQVNFLLLLYLVLFHYLAVIKDKLSALRPKKGVNLEK